MPVPHGKRIWIDTAKTADQDESPQRPIKYQDIIRMNPAKMKIQLLESSVGKVKKWWLLDLAWETNIYGSKENAGLNEAVDKIVWNFIKS